LSFELINIFIAIFKLKIQNVALVALLPTYLSRKAYENEVDKRISNMWRVHRNRVDKNLGPTYSTDGNHESMD
jgi:hypothetical protein